MPRILHDPATHIVLQLRLQQPGPVSFIIAPRPLPDLRRCDGELRAAGHADDGREGRVGEEVGEGGAVVGFCCWRGAGAAAGDDFRGAAERPGAAEVEVAGVVDVGEAEVGEGWDAVCRRERLVEGTGKEMEERGTVDGVVVVPLVAGAVVEDGYVGEGVVVVEDETVGRKLN